MKLFKTGSIDVVKDHQSFFAIDLSSCVLKRRQYKFVLRYKNFYGQFFSILQLPVIIVVVYIATSLVNKKEYWS